MITKIPVIIICGAKDTCLKEETEFRPKPVVTVGDRQASVTTFHLTKYPVQ